MRIIKGYNRVFLLVVIVTLALVALLLILLLASFGILRGVV
jgi:hypothetical protein